jgi:Domain of unknown function (DUF932)
MKEGQSLAQLAKQIKSERDARKDFLATTTQLRYVPEGEVGHVALKVEGKHYEAVPTRHCLRQIGDRVGIPSKYVDRMLGENVPLLAENVNWWWKHQPEKRMLRTLLNGSHIARAFLSSSFRPLENADLAAIILPKLAELECNILSCQITETRLYIQAATPRIEAKAVGDIVQAGIVVSNSEVGAGALSMEPLLYYLRCLNGMVLPRVMSRYHIGRRNDPMFELDSAAEYYTDATREQDDKAFWMKVKDVADGLFDQERFTERVTKFEDASEQKLKVVTEAVEEVSNRFKLNEDESNKVLNHLIEGGDTSLFGLINAVTATATDVESYDRSVELQRIGGHILELPKSTWN